MSRNGKIARLPGPIREQINRRLENGENGREIISWLNSHDDVKAVLAREFHGNGINDVNLCQWRKGGYRDWEIQQATLDETHRVVSEGLELNKVGQKELAEKLAVWLLGRYIVATRKLVENEDDPAAWKLLREMCHDVVALRRGDHGAEWVRIEREKLKLQRRKCAGERKKANLDLENNPPLPPMSEEEKERHFDEIFGTLYPEPISGMHQWNQAPDAADIPSPPPEKVSSEVTDLQPSIPSLPRLEEDPQARELQQVMELAEKGDAYSAYCLGARYRDGFGVAKDLAKAQEWLQKAASQSLGGAKIELHALLMHPGH